MFVHIYIYVNYTYNNVCIYAYIYIKKIEYTRCKNHPRNPGEMDLTSKFRLYIYIYMEVFDIFRY